MRAPAAGRLAVLLASGLCPVVPCLAAERVPIVLSGPTDGGTSVVLVEDHRAAIVHLTVEIPVGTWSPWARRRHLEEAFERQLDDPDGRLRARADALAMDLFLSVGDRQSRFEAAFLKENLSAALELVRDVLSNPSFDRAELRRRERERRLAWQASLRSPFFVVAQAAHRRLFAAGDPRRLPYEAPPGFSTDAKLLAAARDSALRLPGRVVGFAGDLTPEEAERAAAGLLPPLSPVRPEGLEPDLRSPRAAEERGDDVTVRLPRLTQVYLAYGRDSLPWTDPDYPAFVVADHVLGGHFYSRLYEALRHEGGETYGAATASLGDVVVGAYGLGTFTRVPNAAKTEAKLREALHVFHEKGITEEERTAAVGYLRGRRAAEKQSPVSILSRFLRERRLDLPPAFLDELPDRAAAVSLEEINHFIARWYDPAGFGMVRAAPRLSRSMTR